VLLNALVTRFELQRVGKGVEDRNLCLHRVLVEVTVSGFFEHAPQFGSDLPYFAVRQA
jgi:hypothetical protein